MILGRVSPRSVKLASPLWTAKEFLLICHKELQMTNRISIFRKNLTTNQSSTWFTKDHNLSVLMQKNKESNPIGRQILGCHLFLLQTSSNWTIRSILWPSQTKPTMTRKSSSEKVWCYQLQTISSQTPNCPFQSHLWIRHSSRSLLVEGLLAGLAMSVSLAIVMRKFWSWTQVKSNMQIKYQITASTKNRNIHMAQIASKPNLELCSNNSIRSLEIIRKPKVQSALTRMQTSPIIWGKSKKWNCEFPN